MLNSILAQRYQILELIGGGGMADVYKALDTLLDRQVAVKVLRSQFTHDDEFVRKFRREAQAAAKLSHPNIVNIYDVGCEGTVHYIVMEYVDGDTLKDHILRGIIPVDTALAIACEIGEALEHAHHNNLVHCDIKPHNILMTRKGHVKVTDFGIARAVSSATMSHTSTIIGSVHYFSPEQAKGEKIGAKADMYSLGVVMYEMLTGTLPFAGETPISIALKHLQEAPKAPREIDPTIPLVLEAVILKAMAKDPEQRFRNIREMIHDLKSLQGFVRDDSTKRLERVEFATQIIGVPQADELTAEQTVVRPSARPERTMSRRRRWSFIVALLLLAGFAGGAFLSYGKFWSSREVTVPDVVGKQVDIARNVLLNQNLRITLSESYDDKVPLGHVISQYPEAGAVVKEQRAITVVVSKGSEVTTVPDLKGLNRRDAEAKLKSAGLTIGRVDEVYNPELPLESVISQNPRPPAQVNKNTPIDLVINHNSGVKKVALPDWRGLPLPGVTAQAESLKLKIGKVTEEASERYAPGTVISQNPSGGAEVIEDSSVDLVVSKTGSSTKRVGVQITVPDGPSRQTVQIVVNDAAGKRTVYENVHKPGDRIEKTVEGSASGKVQVFVNGVSVKEQAF
ncbi:Stk1 family PASTA domain-containing Ser/Thr kinase [Azotosporobacter soli]|uniref:Stk1 family PASTA domain-containing Ser/Thr kinase n=1 Tax=Azotosporobacter soli TaxID=3055040 RepID=UPI0031FE842D